MPRSPAHQPRQASLRTLLIIPLVVQVLVAVGLAGWLAHRNGQQAVEALAHQLLEDSGARLRHQLEAEVAIPPVVTQQNADALALGQLDPADLKSWAPHLVRQSDRFPDLTYIYYGSSQDRYVEIHKFPDGRLEFAVKSSPDEAYLSIYSLTVEGAIGDLLRISTYEYYHRDRPWYRTAETSELPLWTDSYEFTGEAPQLGISFVHPYRTEDRSLNGVLGADFTLSTLKGILQSLTLAPASETFLMEPDGTILASSEERAEANELGQGGTLGQLAAEQIQAQLGDLNQLDAEQRIQFRIEDAAYWVQVTPVADDYGLRWLGVSVIPETAFTAEIRHNNRNTVLLCLLALAMSTGASLLLAQRLNRPILQLGLASQALAAGSPHPPVKPSPIREVNLLVQSFNQMATDLAQSRSQLKAQSQQLETLVEQRTQALRQSEEKFAAAFQASPNAVVLTTLEEGRYLEVNDRFAQLLEMPKEEILGRTSTALKLWVAPYSRADYLQQLTQGKIQNQEWQLRTASGEIKTVLLSSEIIDVQGEPCILSIANDISDRKQAQNALTASQAKFQRLVDDIGDKFVIFSHTGIDGVVTYVSGGFAAVFGRQKEDMVGKPWGSSVNWLPQDAAVAQNAVIAGIERGVEFHQFEMRFIHPSGEQRTVVVSQHPVKGDDGQAIAIEGILEDITERKRTEAQLRRNEAQLAAAQRIAHVGNWEIELKTRKTTWSAELLQIFGFDPKGPPPTYAQAFRRLHPEDHDRWTKLFRRLISTGVSYETDLRVVLPNGELRYVEGRGEAVQDEQGCVIRVLGTGLDVTVRKRAESELAQQLQRQHLLSGITNQIRQSLDIQRVYETTVEEVGQTFAVSRCVLHTYIESSTARVINVGQYLVPGHRSMAQMTLPVDSPYAQAILTSNCAIATPDVHRAPLLKPATKLLNRFQIKSILAICTSYQGKPNGFISLHQCDRQRHWTEDEVSLLEDVASQVGIAIAQAHLLRQEQHQREQLARQNIALDQAIQAAEAASKAKSEFLANMSHELRTPLNAILGFSRLMARDANLTPTQTGNLNIINRSGEHLLELINRVLDMSKIESGRATLYPTDFHLPQLLTDIVNLFTLRAREKGLAIAVDLAPNLPTQIHADAGKLRQVLVNLLSNALKSTEAGAVTLRAAPAGVQSSGSNTDLTLCFEVEDSGCGIKPDAMPQIFQAFVQSEVGFNTRSGTGLGLTITQKFVELMGGQITVASGGVIYTPGLHPEPIASAHSPAEGSCFRFTVKAALGQDALQMAQPPHRVVGLAADEVPRRILVVEDIWESRHLLLQTLSPIGFEVRGAENGQVALEIWREWRPELIWMDMRMPVMDGYQATRYIKAQPEGQNTVIIALTASSLDSERASILAGGCDDYVRKPFQTEVLLEKIAEHLGVRYRYERSGVAEAATPQPGENQGVALEKYLAQMPPDWVQGLGQAAAIADNDLIAELMGNGRNMSPELYRLIQDAVDNFRYDIVIQATQTALEPLPEELQQ
ncbi:MAG: PAS domain S-box protein [Elainellaceae cyanobacterium]